MNDNRPTVTFAGGFYFWHGDFKQRGIPSAAGFDYHPATKRWRTRSAFKASSLIDYADAATADLIRNAMTMAGCEMSAKIQVAS